MTTLPPIAAVEPSAADARPPLMRDAAFWGMTVTQFLGAFNDNLFKQLVLLICTEYVRYQQLDHDPYQTTAQALFAIPFVLFSGFAGFLSDRFSKRTIIVLCKVAEIVVMGGGLLAFFSSGMLTQPLLWSLFALVFLMGTHSAFFGPSKYGILPELFHDRDLPRANGIVQMTTFLAIIFGTALAGYGKKWYDDRLWVITGWCIGLAVVGTLTTMLIRRTAVADATLPFRWSSLAIDAETWRVIRRDRPLFNVLLLSSWFWLIGGVVLPAVNALGKEQLRIDDARTSVLAVCMGIGIAVGCVLAGRFSGGRVNFRLVSLGAWGIVVTMTATALVAVSGWPVVVMEWIARVSLTALGVFAGLFAVPVQVFIQARPPEDQKGRMIGAMNLINWIGILLAAGVYGGCSALLGVKHISWTFLILALLMLPVALLFHPRDEELS